MADPFTILGVEPAFDLDVPRLEARHRELSRALHPDRYGGRPSSERRMALSRAIEVNEAFRALKDPVRRAEALLARHSIEIEEGQEARPAADFLMDVLELREDLASAHKRRDLRAVAELKDRVERREAAVLGELRSRFDDLARLAADVPADTVERIGRKLGEVRYYRRFLEEARTIEDELG